MVDDNKPKTSKEEMDRIAAEEERLEYPRRMIFQNIMEGQEVGLGEAEAIFMDHQGFMWLGGRNALVRYDGKNFASIPTEIIENGDIPTPTLVKINYDKIEETQLAKQPKELQELFKGEQESLEKNSAALNFFNALLTL